MCDKEQLNEYASWIDEATSKEELLDALYDIKDDLTREDDDDNDEVVYYFYLNDEQLQPLTLEEYNQLVDKYFPEDELIDLNMQKFTIENIEKLV